MTKEQKAATLLLVKAIYAVMRSGLNNKDIRHIITLAMADTQDKFATPERTFRDVVEIMQ